jgi:hypothetical protein
MTTDGTVRLPVQSSSGVDAPAANKGRVHVDSDGVVKAKLNDGTVVSPYAGKAPVAGHAVPWFDIAAYGTVDRTGTNSCDAAATATMAAIAASPRGGLLFLGPGVLKISTGIIDYSTGVGATTGPQGIRGVDRGLTVIIPNGTGDVVKFNAAVDGCSAQDFAIFSSGATQTAGNAINTNGADDVLIRNMLFNNQFVDVNVQNTSIKVSMQQLVHTHSVNNGANSVGILVTNGAAGDTYIGPDVVMSDTGSTRRRACVEVVQSGHFELNQCNLTGSAQGLLIDPGANQSAVFGFVNHTLLDSNFVNGCTINATSATSCVVKSIHFVNSWFSGTVSAGLGGSGAAGFLSTGTAGGVVNGITFTNCRALNNQTHGYQHGFGTDFEWIGGRSSGNSAAATTTSSGLSAAAGVSNWGVIGGKWGGSDQVATGGQQKYGIEVVAGAGDNIRIIGPDLIGNITQGLLFGATGLNCYVEGCINGPRRQARRATADAAAITATTATDLPGMTFNVEVGASYTFSFDVLLTNTAATGHKFAIVVPTGATIDAIAFEAVTAATFRQDTILAGATLTATAVQTVAATEMHHRIVGVVQGATAAGVCKLQAAVVTSGSLVLKRGSSFVATPALP